MCARAARIQFSPQRRRGHGEETRSEGELRGASLPDELVTILTEYVRFRREGTAERSSAVVALWERQNRRRSWITGSSIQRQDDPLRVLRARRRSLCARGCSGWELARWIGVGGISEPRRRVYAKAVSPITACRGTWWFIKATTKTGAEAGSCRCSPL